MAWPGKLMSGEGHRKEGAGPEVAGGSGGEEPHAAAQIVGLVWLGSRMDSRKVFQRPWGLLPGVSVEG